MDIYSYSHQGFDGEIVAVNAERSNGRISITLNPVALHKYGLEHEHVQIKPGHVHTILLQNKLFGNLVFDFTKNAPESRSSKSLTLNEISICQEDVKKMSKEQLAKKLFNLTFNCNGETSEFRKAKLDIYFTEFSGRLENKSKNEVKKTEKPVRKGRGR